MKEEIKSEFEKAGFNLDEEEEILSKCNRFFFFPLLINRVMLLISLYTELFCKICRSHLLHQLQSHSYGSRLKLGNLLP